MVKLYREKISPQADAIEAELQDMIFGYDREIMDTPAAAEMFGSGHSLPVITNNEKVVSRPLADWYEDAVRAHPSNPKAIANWLLSDLLGRMTDAEKQAGRLPVAPDRLAELVARIDDGTISGKIAKELLPELIRTGRPPGDLIREKGLVQISDEGPIREVVRRIVSENPGQVATYRGGKAATFGWFVGQVTKATGGKASPAVVNRLLREVLDQVS